jgi:hypothetical protein
MGIEPAGTLTLNPISHHVTAQPANHTRLYSIAKDLSSSSCHRACSFLPPRLVLVLVVVGTPCPPRLLLNNGCSIVGAPLLGGSALLVGGRPDQHASQCARPMV